MNEEMVKQIRKANRTLTVKCVCAHQHIQAFSEEEEKNVFKCGRGRDTFPIATLIPTLKTYASVLRVSLIFRDCRVVSCCFWNIWL